MALKKRVSWRFSPRPDTGLEKTQLFRHNPPHEPPLLASTRYRSNEPPHELAQDLVAILGRDTQLAQVVFGQGSALRLLQIIK